MLPEPASRGPWGSFATVAFTLVIAGGFLFAQGVLAIPYLLLTVQEKSQSAMEAAMVSLGSDGFFLAISEVVSGAVVLVLTIVFAWARKGPAVREYLGLVWVPRADALRWLLYAVVVLLVLEGIAWLTGHPPVPEWMKDVYLSAGWLPLFILATVLVAPLIEELVFRGFLFAGLRTSWLGDAGTVFLTSVVFAAIHFGQYEAFYVGQVLAVGLLLGTARARTGSVLLTMVMHALVNAVAMLQVVLEMRLVNR